MKTTRCDGVRVGGFGASFALHVLAIGMVCMPAARPDRVRGAAPPPLQWVSAIAPLPATPPPPLPPPPSPPPRPARSAPVPPSPVPAALPPARSDAPAATLPVSTAAVSGAAASLATDAPAAPSAPPSSAMEGALAYAQVRDPIYPVDALRRGEQGVVMLRVWVAENGAAARVEIERSSGSPRLDRAARDAVRQWRFDPPRVGGVPKAAMGLVPIVFRLPANA